MVQNHQGSIDYPVLKKAHPLKKHFKKYLIKGINELLRCSSWVLLHLNSAKSPFCPFLSNYGFLFNFLILFLVNPIDYSPCLDFHLNILTCLPAQMFRMPHHPLCSILTAADACDQHKPPLTLPHTDCTLLRLVPQECLTTCFVPLYLLFTSAF